MSLALHQQRPLLLEMLVVTDMMREAHRHEAGMLSAPVARRERLAENAGHFMFLCVPRIVRHPVDARSWHLVTGLEYFACHDISFQVLDGVRLLCERRRAGSAPAEEVRRGVAGGSRLGLNLPRSGCYVVGPMAAWRPRRSKGGLPRVLTPSGAVSKAQPVNHHAALVEVRMRRGDAYLGASYLHPSGRIRKTPPPAIELSSLAITPGGGDITPSLNSGGFMEDRDQDLERERERVRSPNYPSLGLATAIQRVDALYKRDGKAAARTVAVVRAWGYNTLNGRSLSTLGALRQYGLLEDTGPKMVRLSQTALTIQFSKPGSPEYQRAILEAAHRPKVFAELFDQYKDGYPTDDTMVRNLALTSTYSEEAASRLIAAFRETIDLIEQISGTTSRDMADDQEAHNGDPERDRKRKKGELTMPMIESPAGTPPYDLALALMDGEHAVLRIPRHMSEENFKLLSSLIDANLKAMKLALVVTKDGQ
jgi:hypothetical protein